MLPMEKVCLFRQVVGKLILRGTTTDNSDLDQEQKHEHKGK